MPPFLTHIQLEDHILPALNISSNIPCIGNKCICFPPIVVEYRQDWPIGELHFLMITSRESRVRMINMWTAGGIPNVAWLCHVILVQRFYWLGFLIRARIGQVGQCWFVIGPVSLKTMHLNWTRSWNNKSNKITEISIYRFYCSQTINHHFKLILDSSLSEYSSLNK